MTHQGGLTRYAVGGGLTHHAPGRVDPVRGGFTHQDGLTWWGLVKTHQGVDGNQRVNSALGLDKLFQMLKVEPSLLSGETTEGVNLSKI